MARSDRNDWQSQSGYVLFAGDIESPENRFRDYRSHIVATHIRNIAIEENDGKLSMEMIENLDVRIVERIPDTVLT